MDVACAARYCLIAMHHRLHHNGLWHTCVGQQAALLEAQHDLLLPPPPLDLYSSLPHHLNCTDGSSFTTGKVEQGKQALKRQLAESLRASTIIRITQQHQNKNLSRSQQYSCSSNETKSLEPKRNSELALMGDAQGP